MAINKFGGWVVEENPSIGKLPQELASGFYTAAEHYTGMQLNPILYCGSQVVNGINYMVICEGTIVTAAPEKKILAVVVHSSPDGKYTITSVDTLLSATESAGGWTIPQDVAKGVLPEEVTEGIAAVSSGLLGIGLEAVLFCGTQIVSGVNYMVICKENLVKAEPSRKIVDVILNRTPNGEYTIIRNNTIIG